MFQLALLVEDICSVYCCRESDLIWTQIGIGKNCFVNNIFILPIRNIIACILLATVGLLTGYIDIIYFPML